MFEFALGVCLIVYTPLKAEIQSKLIENVLSIRRWNVTEAKKWAKGQGYIEWVIIVALSR